MKSPISKAAKIGTVAGLAALAASEASQAAVVLSTFSNVDLSGAFSSPITIDIDGDGDTEFTITTKTGDSSILEIQGNGASILADFSTNIFAVEEGYFHINGSTLPNGASGSYNPANFFSPSTPTGQFYAAARFSTSNGTHFGWLQFEIPSNATINGAVLIGGAWETEAYEGISIGAVPEPSALIFSFATGAAALLRRRRK